MVGTARQLIARPPGRHAGADRPTGRGDDLGRPGDDPGRPLHLLSQAGLCRRLLHVAADGPAGQIVVPETIVNSSADSVSIVVNGVGTHGAYPHLGVDPVLVASQIVVSLQSMVGRDINPLEGAVISVGSIHGGVKSNIIPERVELQLTVRADRPEVRARLLDGIDRVAAAPLWRWVCPRIGFRS
jgi:hippurate hydrolase